MDSYIMKIEMLEVSVPPGMEHDHDGDNLARTQFRLSLGLISQKVVFNGIVKFNAEFIN